MNLGTLAGHVGKGVRKAKAELEIRGLGGIKVKKKRFYHCVSGKRLNKGKCGPAGWLI